MSVDGWSHKNHSHYLSIVLYWVDASMKARHAVIGFPVMLGAASSDAMLAVIIACLASWGLTLEDINLFVSDGASVMSCLADKMKKINKRMSWIWCMAHTQATTMFSSRHHRDPND